MSLYKSGLYGNPWDPRVGASQEQSMHVPKRGPWAVPIVLGLTVAVFTIIPAKNRR